MGGLFTIHLTVDDRQDRKGTPFWLAMIRGKKRVVMYSHNDAHLLYPFGAHSQSFACRCGGSVLGS